MAAVAKIIAAMRNNPTGVRYADAMKVAEATFGLPRQSGSSHAVFKTPWQGDPRVNLQKGKGGKAKPYQIRQLLMAIDRMEDEQ